MRISVSGDAVAAYRCLRGLNQKDLADIAQISRTHLISIEKDGTNCATDTLSQLALGLRVPIGALIQNFESEGVSLRYCSESFRSSELPRWQDIHDLIGRATRLITINRRLDSYVQSDEMLPIHNPGSFSNARTMSIFMDYVKGQRESYGGNSFLHLLVFPKVLFSVRKLCTIEWLGGLKESISSVYRPTYTLPIEDFPVLTETLSNCLGTSCHGFKKMNIVDQDVAILHFDNAVGPDITICYHRKSIRKLVELTIEHARTKSEAAINGVPLDKWSKRAAAKNRKALIATVTQAERTSVRFISSAERELYVDIT